MRVDVRAIAPQTVMRNEVKHPGNGRISARFLSLPRSFAAAQDDKVASRLCGSESPIPPDRRVPPTGSRPCGTEGAGPEKFHLSREYSEPVRVCPTRTDGARVLRGRAMAHGEAAMLWKCVRLYSMFAIAAVGVALAAAGCQEREDPIPSGTFRAVVDDVVVDDLLLVKRVTITAPGTRGVAIFEKGGRDWIRADRDRETGLATVRVVFVADLIKFQPRSENVLRWMVRMKAGGATVGGPALSTVGSAESLDDVLMLNFTSGLHALSQDITLGHVQDREHRSQGRVAAVRMDFPTTAASRYNRSQTTLVE